jgi:hypothetical protein
MKMTILALFFGLTLPAFGQDVDPMIGAWKLNLEKKHVHRHTSLEK